MRHSYLTFILFLFVGCSQLSWGPHQPLIVMTYNVENLFDTDHDEGKQDWAYLPKDHPVKREGCLQVSSPHWQRECFAIDWTPEKLEIKLNQIKKVIESSSDRRPHILVLTEVENLAVASALASMTGHTQVFITEGADQRGIDIAFLLDLPPGVEVIAWKEVDVTEGNKGLSRPTRPIGKLILSLPEGILVVYGSHWPSQGAPNESRLHAARVHVQSLKRVRQQYPDAYIISTGDFNVIDSNRPNALELLVEEGQLVDVHTLFMKSDLIADKDKEGMALGTYFFARNQTWNLLDRILINDQLFNENSGLRADLASYEIVARDYMLTAHRVSEPGAEYGHLTRGVPKRYNFQATRASQAGFSDHFPVKLKILRGPHSDNR